MKQFSLLISFMLLSLVGMAQYTGTLPVTLSGVPSGATGVQWYKDGLAISGETNATYNATTVGQYYASFTDDGTACTNDQTVLFVLLNSGESVILTGSTNNGSGSAYQWYNAGTTISGQNASDYTATVGGLFSLKYNNGSCEVETQKYYIFVLETDTDGDGIPDATDLDDDNDGILDTVENAQANADMDGDGIPNSLDLDSDNDGISDLVESGNAAAIAADTDGDGQLSPTESAPGANGVPLAAETTEGGTVPAPKDQDGDGKPDAYDLDSDNDGINDLTESGNAAALAADTNGDGTLSPSESPVGTDGIPNVAQTVDGGPVTAPVDTDGDGIINSRDLDSDNDGINDVTEAGVDADTNGDGQVDGTTDADNDGIIDSVDANPAVFGDPSTTDSPSSAVTTPNGPVITGTDPDGDGIVGTADSLPNAFGDSSSALPISLLSLSGMQIEEAIHLTWKTANEKNFSHFEVQKSENAKEFGSINVVKGNNANIYNTIDNNPTEGTNYYRLKMVDMDGTSKLSNIISITFEKGADFAIVENPANGNSIMIETNLKAPKFILVNGLGKQISFTSFNTESNKFRLDIANYAPGIYYLNINANGKTITKKVLMY